MVGHLALRVPGVLPDPALWHLRQQVHGAWFHEKIRSKHLVFKPERALSDPERVVEVVSVAMRPCDLLLNLCRTPSTGCA